MSNEYQNLSQLRSGNISSCYGIVVNFTTPKKTKAKDFLQTISLVDPSTNGQIIKLFIFNPELKSFPTIEKGDILYCKNVKVQEFNFKIQLKSYIISTFIVFPKDKNNFEKENSIITNYRKWWDENKYSFQNNSNYTKCTCKISELNQNIKYFDIYCQLIRIFDYNSSDRTSVLLTDYTENELLETKVFHENPNIHAKIYLTCTFWDEYAVEIKKFNEGDFIFIKNVVLKFNNGSMEGVIHGNSNWNQLYILENGDRNMNIIKNNRENFLKNNLEISSTPPSPKDKKKISDRSVSLIDDSIIITEKVNDLITSDDSFINNDFSEITTSTPKKDNKINRNDNLFSNSPINQNNILIHNNQSLTMPIRITNIKHVNMPITKIKDVLISKQIPNKYRCRVKVVDFMPRKFENFTRPYCTICKKTFDKIKDKKVVTCSRCNSTGDKIKYAFMFSFLVEDDGEKFLPIIIFEIEKSEFLGLPATSLSDPKDIEKLRSRLSKFWTFESKNCFTNKEKTISRTKTVLIGKFFDVCIERYKNTQGIRQKVFDTKLNL